MKKKFYFKKRGFTLIELLAVIVILAIILLVAMPIVISVIDDARKGAFEASAQGLLKTVNQKYMTSAMHDGGSSATYIFEEGGLVGYNSFVEMR